MTRDPLLIGVTVLLGVGATAAATYAFVRWLFGDLLP